MGYWLRVRGGSNYSIIIKGEGVGDFVTFSTSFLNIITLGLVSAYDHDDYTVSFLDPSNNLGFTYLCSIQTIRKTEVGKIHSATTNLKFTLIHSIAHYFTLG